MNDLEKRYNNLVKEHIDTITRNENKAKEIERLKRVIKDLIEENTKLREQIVNLKNKRIIFIDEESDYELPIQKYR